MHLAQQLLPSLHYPALFMNPLLAITAARVGSNILNNLSNNVGAAKGGPSPEDAKKAAFAEMIAKAANTPQAKHTRALDAKGIASRSDAEGTLNQMAQKILQSPEVSKVLGGRSEAFELRFLPDGSVAVKKADGTEETFKLDGQLQETAKEAVAIIESVKIAYPQSGSPSNQAEPGGSLRIVPGGRASLLA